MFETRANKIYFSKWNVIWNLHNSMFYDWYIIVYNISSMVLQELCLKNTHTHPLINILFKYKVMLVADFLISFFVLLSLSSTFAPSTPRFFFDCALMFNISSHFWFKYIFIQFYYGQIICCMMNWSNSLISCYRWICSNIRTIVKFSKSNQQWVQQKT